MTTEPKKLGRLKKRAEFLFVAQRDTSGKNLGAYAAKPNVIVQMRQNPDRAQNVHVGFTATKKTGNAVVRNRAKRRLRVCARGLLPELGRAGHDYVFIARNATAKAEWPQLLKDVEKALLTLQ